MANIFLTRGTLAKVQAQAVTDGQLLYAYDAGIGMIDVGTTRYIMKNFQVVDGKPEAADMIDGVLYYDKTNGGFYALVDGAVKDTIPASGAFAVNANGTNALTANEVVTSDADGKLTTIKGTNGQVLTWTADNKAAFVSPQFVTSVTAEDNSITIGGTNLAPTVAVKISASDDNVLTLADDGLKVAKGAAPEYTLVKSKTTTEGYLATYQLQKDGVDVVGSIVDIPKDYLVKSGSVKTAVGDDPSGFPAGTKYLDFVVNAKTDDGTESHIYINVADLVDVYTAGQGIEISDTNVISAKVSVGNGLSINGSGIGMGLASATDAGAMSSAQYDKLDKIEAGAQVNYVKSVKAPFAVSAEGELSASDATANATGLMTAAQAGKLDGIEEGAEVNYVKSVAAPVTVSAAGQLSVAKATEAADGLMAKEDKVKLNGIADGAEVNYINSVEAPFTVTGGKLDCPDATADTDGLMTTAQATKLDGIAAGAQVNVIEKVTFNGVQAAIDASTKTAAITFQWNDLV